MKWQARLTPEEPTVSIPLGFEGKSLGVYNMTPYPIYLAYSGQIPTADSYDLIIPAAKSLSQALPGNRSYAAFMDTSGVTATFVSPPAVLTFDSEPNIPSFSQVHLTYPYSGNLQFLARTEQIDQYASLTLAPLSGNVFPINLIVPATQLYVIRRVMVRAFDALANNQAFVRVDATRGPAGINVPVIYHYFSPPTNRVWLDYPDLNIVCSHQWANDIRAVARNFSAVNPITIEIHCKIDVIQARLP